MNIFSVATMLRTPIRLRVVTFSVTFRRLSGVWCIAPTSHSCSQQMNMTVVPVLSNLIVPSSCRPRSIRTD